MYLISSQIPLNSHKQIVGHLDNTMNSEKGNESNLVAPLVLATILLAAVVMSITTTENALAYKKNQATTAVNECGNGQVSTNIGCQNIDSQIQGDENAVALTAQQTFPALIGEESSSSPPPSGAEENCFDGADNDGDGLIDLEDDDCERAPPPLEGNDEPLEE